MSKNNSIERERHHYVPKFYLEKWYLIGVNYFLRYKRNKNGAIQGYRKPAKTTCDVEGLYLIRHDGLLPGGGLSNKIETDFFAKKIDGPAAVIHSKILSQGLSSLTEEDRFIWARFISSMIERSPERIDAIFKLSQDKIKSLVLSYPLKRRFDIDLVVKNAVLHAMKRRIEDNDIANEVFRMNWFVVDCSASCEHFLVSDRPLVINSGGEAPPIFAISFALSPEKVIVMCVDDPVFDEDFVKLQAVSYNIHMFKQANKYIISSRPLSEGVYIKYVSAANLLLGQP